MRKILTLSLVLLLGAMGLSATAQEGAMSEDDLNALSAAEKLSTSADYVRQVQEVIERGGQLLADAKKQEDVSRMDCINEKLVAAKGFLSVVQNSNANLSDAVNRNDEAASLHHMKLGNMAATRCVALGHEMMGCVGANLEYTGPTKLEAKRSCKIEPCLEGDGLTSPESDATTKPAADASPYM
ncbi:MAG: hypothetical protein WC966_04075 [Bradymonadales bacterium]|jgi:hypothetical protein